MRSIISSSSSDHSNGSSRTHLYLNVYDLTPLNNYMYWFGVGIYHSGIEAYGVEYAFGAHDYPSSGVFEVEPKSCPGFLFRRSISLGTTDMSSSEFRLFIEHMAGCYNGKCIPGWVNRLARIGSFCNCLLPESIQVTAVQHTPEYQELSDQGISEDESDSPSTQGFGGSDGEQDHQLLISTTAESLSFTKDSLRGTAMNHIKEVL